MLIMDHLGVHRTISHLVVIQSFAVYYCASLLSVLFFFFSLLHLHLGQRIWPWLLYTIFVFAWCLVVIVLLIKIDQKLISISHRAFPYLTKSNGLDSKVMQGSLGQTYIPEYNSDVFFWRSIFIFNRKHQWSHGIIHGKIIKMFLKEKCNKSLWFRNFNLNDVTFSSTFI